MHKQQSLTSLAEVKRIEKNKIYPKETLYIQVSACKRGGEDAWHILKEDSILEDKYAVAIPKIPINPKYLVIALNYQTPQWHARYVGTNINISMNAFDFLIIDYDDDLDAQKRIIEMIEEAEKVIRAEEAYIEEYKKIKEWYLSKLFP